MRRQERLSVRTKRVRMKFVIMEFRLRMLFECSANAQRMLSECSADGNLEISKSKSGLPVFGFAATSREIWQRISLRSS